MNQETFDQEIGMCQKLHLKNNGQCNWGECYKCGVIPLLYKLHKGEIIDKSEDIAKIKKEIFK